MATLHIKVVPGARRDRIVGRLGNAIKVQVSAAPERGKANQAVIKLIAATIGLPRQQIQLIAGATNPRKTLQIQGILQEELDRRLAEIL
jgi:uncharacterized protein (TIGR00251 family)